VPLASYVVDIDASGRRLRCDDHAEDTDGITRRQLLVRGGAAAAALGAGGGAVALAASSESGPDPGPGSWGELIPTDGVAPVHASLLPSGKVLMNGPSGGGEIADFVIDPLNEGIEVDGLYPPMRMNEDTLFCAGHAPLADGRLLLVGGQRSTPELGLEYALLFDYRTAPGSGWTPIEDSILGGPSWYPTVTRLANGDMLVISGFADWGGEENRTIQLFHRRRFDAGRSPWTTLVPHEKVPDVSPTGADYTHVFALPRPVMLDGHQREVAMVGATGEIWFLSHTGRFADPADRFATRPNARRPAPPNASPGAGTSSAMLADGRILIVGSGDEDGEGEPSLMSRADVYDPYRDEWRSIETGIGRIYPVAILLPDGMVAIVNGDGGRGDSRVPQIIDPESGVVSGGPRWPDDGVRGYHNSALLVPDGRVLTASGESGGLSGRPGGPPERTDLRYYSPPYLSVLAEAERPEILRAPRRMRYGRLHTIRVRNGPIHRVTLLAPGAMTHSIDMNQRCVILFDGDADGDEIAVAGPRDSSVAPPGGYMLFALRELDGIFAPSHGRMIRVE
jgi:Domain of unknown function (DUF1929)